jgi:hypothetical protein
VDAKLIAANRAAEELQSKVAQLTKHAEVLRSENGKLRALVDEGLLKDLNTAAAGGLTPDNIVAQLNGVTIDSEAAAIIVRAIPTINRKISGTEFARILDASRISIDSTKATTIAACARYLKHPLTADETLAILKGISIDSSRRKAIEALNDAASE